MSGRLGPRIISADDTTVPADLPAAPAILAVDQGGTGLDTSTSTGVPYLYGGSWVIDGAYIRVNDFTSTAIQAAIDALPATGGDVLLPAGTYDCTAQINIGDGTTTTASTRRGVRLIGIAPPVYGADTLSYPASPVVLSWSGDVSGTMMAVAGPLRGFECHNIQFDGAGSADYGLIIQSVGNAKLSCVTFTGCTAISLYTTCVSATTAGFSTNTDVLLADNIVVYVPSVAAAYGIYLTGHADGSASTCYATFTNTRIYLDGTEITYGVLLQVADACRFDNLLVYGTNNVAGTYGVVFDYSVHTSFPTQCLFVGPDVGWEIPAASQWMNSGSPAASINPNTILGLAQGNGGAYPTDVANLECGLPLTRSEWVAYTDRGTAVGATTIVTPYLSYLWRATYYLAMTAAGTGGTVTLTLGWTDTVGLKTASSSALDATDATAYAQGEVIILNAATTTIQYAVSFGGVTGSPTFDLRVRLERLS